MKMKEYSFRSILFLWGAIVAVFLTNPLFSQDIVELYQMANEHFELGNYREAIKLYSLGLELAPNSPTSYLALTYRAKAYIATGELELAEADLKKSIKMNNEFVPTISTMGDLEAERKNREGALAYYNICMKKEPENTAHYLSRAAVYIKWGETERAMGEITKALEVDPESSEAIFYRALLKSKNCNYSGTVGDLSTYLTKNPDNPTAYVLRGEAYEAQKMYKEALTDYGSALSLNPLLFDALVKRGQLFYRLKLYDKALVDLTAAAELQPQRGDIYYNIGVILECMGDRKKAKTYFEKACSIDEKYCDF
jgi:tetratricopeptide (TPR) repeat protein